VRPETFELDAPAAPAGPPVDLLGRLGSQVADRGRRRDRDPAIGRLLEAHPGVVRASVGKAGLLLIVDYDPAVIGLPDVASIVRLAGHRVASGPG